MIFSANSKQRLWDTEKKNDLHVVRHHQSNPSENVVEVLTIPRLTGVALSQLPLLVASKGRLSQWLFPGEYSQLEQQLTEGHRRFSAEQPVRSAPLTTISATADIAQRAIILIFNKDGIAVRASKPRIATGLKGEEKKNTSTQMITVSRIPELHP